MNEKAAFWLARRKRAREALDAARADLAAVAAEPWSRSKQHRLDSLDRRVWKLRRYLDDTHRDYARVARNIAHARHAPTGEPDGASPADVFRAGITTR